MLVEQEGGQRLEHRHLDLDRPLAPAGPRDERGEDGIDGVQRGDLVGEDGGDEARIAAGRGPQSGDAARRLDAVVEGGAVAVATPLAQADRGAMDNEIGRAAWRERGWQDVEIRGGARA